jgi:hypothetical protein
MIEQNTKITKNSTHMKTSKTYRNVALKLLLGLSFLVTVASGVPVATEASDVPADEFANAGYWIDPVVVTYDANNDFSNAGYWIDPVVVTYNANKEFASAGYWIDPVVVTYNANKEFAGAGYWIDPVVVTYATASALAMNE